jgi:hypothetical protein
MWAQGIQSECRLNEFRIQASVSCQIKLMKQQSGDTLFSLGHGLTIKTLSITVPEKNTLF